MREPLRLLVVEDNPADADFIQETLPESGMASFRIESVSRLSEALTRLERRDVDLVLLDLGLPDSQGLASFHRLRQAAPDVPVIVLSGTDDHELALAAVRDGAQDYLVKGQVGGSLLARAARYAVERKRTETALRESIDRFQAASRATFNVIWDWDLKTNALWWNDNFGPTFGFGPDEMEPGIESWTHRIHPDDLDRVKVGIEAAITSGAEPWSAEYRFRRGDGTYATVVDRGIIHLDADGRPVRMIGAMEDVTERHQVAVQLTEQFEELRRWHDATVGREGRVIELKKEVNDLLAQAGQRPRYASVLGLHGSTNDP